MTKYAHLPLHHICHNNNWKEFNSSSIKQLMLAMATARLAPNQELSAYQIKYYYNLRLIIFLISVFSEKLFI